MTTTDNTSRLAAAHAQGKREGLEGWYSADPGFVEALAAQFRALSSAPDTAHKDAAPIDWGEQPSPALKAAYQRFLEWEKSKPEDALREALDGCHGLDTTERVCFYEQDFYVLSNFSAFNLRWNGLTFPTLEHAYHWEKFNVPTEFRRGYHGQVQSLIRSAPSAHEAFKIGQGAEWQPYRRQDWNAVRVGIMGALIRAKADQHEYVKRKLLATGDRELVENSWRDDFWGWGPNRDGQNMLGKLWMQVRAEARAALAQERTP